MSEAEKVIFEIQHVSNMLAILTQKNEPDDVKIVELITLTPPSIIRDSLATCIVKNSIRILEENKESLNDLLNEI